MQALSGLAVQDYHPFGAEYAGAASQPLYRYLHTAKRKIRLGLTTDTHRSTLRTQLAAADVLVHDWALVEGVGRGVS